MRALKNLRFSRIKAVRQERAQKEYASSSFIPFKSHWNKNTIITFKNELVQVIKLNGFSFETADDEDLDNRKNLRNLLLKSLSNGEVSVLSLIHI